MRNLARQIQISANQLAAKVAIMQADPTSDREERENLHLAILDILQLVKKLEKGLRDDGGNSK